MCLIPNTCYQTDTGASFTNTDTTHIFQKSAPWKCHHLLESLEGECGWKDSVLVTTIRNSFSQPRSGTKIKPLLIPNCWKRNVTETRRAWMVVTDFCANNLKDPLKDGTGSLQRQPAKEKIVGLLPE